MSTYKYSLNNYHAIKKAEIIIDGITVLAGVNGCGKSTLSRWLYYLVNTFSRFDELLFNDLKEKLYPLFDLSQDLLQELDQYTDKSSISQYQDITSLFQNISYSNNDSINKLKIFFDDVLSFSQYKLINYLSKEKSESKIQRIYRYLQLDSKAGNNHQANIDRYIEEIKQKANTIFEEYDQMMEERSIGQFFDFIHSNDFPSDKKPDKDTIQLSEDGVELLEKNKCGYLLGLNRAIYVDTPMALFYDNDLAFIQNDVWEKLNKMMITKRNTSNGLSPKNSLKQNKITENSKNILNIVKDLIGGKIIVEEEIFNQLHYIREKDKLVIELKETATGFKSFAYIQRLIQNGYLDDHTLLLIDEPEAHLHPQWIFQFARILVLINKHLGTKIMVASHNPDMVAAIQKIAQKEGVIKNTHFYQSYSTNKGLQFTYKDLGGSINEIFKSFNIAISKIQDYGEEN